MKQTLDFNEFSNSTIEIWKKGVTKELGDKPYDSLIWSFDDNLRIEPYYAESNQRLDVVAKLSKDWSIKESFVYSNPKELNKSLLLSLEGGVNAIEIILEIDEKIDFELLFNEIFVQYIQVFFSGSFASSSTILDYFNYCEKKEIDRSSLTGGLLSHETSEELSERIDLMTSHPSALCYFSIDASEVQTKGGHASHSIVFALNEGARILGTLVERGVSASHAASALRFLFASEPSYFIEIGKLRAFRTLWAQILKAYDADMDVSGAIQIDTRTSALGKNTIESRRWARNIQHLLIEESYFNQLQDAAKGSYYIEEITFKLAAHAWSRFQFWQTKNESLANSIEWNAHIEFCFSEMKKAIENGSKVILGVNKYPNKSEKISQEKSTPTRLVADFESKIGEGAK